MTLYDNFDFKPLVVLHFSSTTPDETKNWVVKRLIARPDEDDGAGLLVRYETDPESHNDILLIGATLDRLLLGAEELRIKKPYKNDTLHEFLISDIHNFKNSGTNINFCLFFFVLKTTYFNLLENLDNFLLKSEKQVIIWDEIQNVRPMQHEHTVPGVPTKSITPNNDTILGLLRDLDFVISVFPLHDKEAIKLMEHDWFMSTHSFFKSQDIHKIRNYFGENVAYYFAFLEFYTKALIPTSILGFLVSIWPGSEFLKYSLFCIFNVIWWSIFMEQWKRLSNKLAYQWGSYDFKVFERPRSLYYGDLQLSPITNQPERVYPRWKRILKKYLVTYPVVMCCLALSLWIYFGYYRIQIKTNNNYPLDSSLFSIHAKLMRTMPSAGYSLLIIPMNLIYKKIATYLTDYENHRLQTGYENNLTSKLFVFYFINCFIGLFYEGFFNVNYGNVVQLLISLVILNAIFLKFTEQIGPYVLKRIKRNQLTEGKPQIGQVSDAVKQAKTLISFDGTYGDYLTIFEQYGYVALFSAVFPWIAICALINNIFELRADAFKYCHVYQRPFAQRAWNIGSWRYAFDILSSIAIVTNTALIAMQPSVREYFSSYTDAEYFLIFVAAEHILLALKFAISFAIPSTPAEVQIAKNKHLYESHQALRLERERRTLKAQVSIKKH
ncbi:unnamed protein product [Rotaria sordida]|uniref:Anoctamin n=1 Tax=Rotaria sordida TaxID=392033 RepID=A0A813T1U4_9BILA|nr:unnamed protein product [Rotaria sordida]